MTVAVAIVGTLVCLGIVRLFTELRVDEKQKKLVWIFRSMERVRIRHLMVWIHKSQKQTSYVIMDPSVISRQR